MCLLHALVIPDDGCLPKLYKGAWRTLAEVVEHQAHTLHPVRLLDVHHGQPLLQVIGHPPSQRDTGLSEHKYGGVCFEI